jgi:hypothetical protein
LLNHALYVDAMPASTIKPIMALGFLLDNPAYRSGPPLQSLWQDLKTSNSKAFLDRLFCMDGGAAAKDCQRPQRVQEAAGLLGWNLGCSKADDSPDCALLDVLFGRPADKRLIAESSKQPMGLPLLYGRLFTEPPNDKAEQTLATGDDWTEPVEASGYRLMSDFRFDLNYVKACRAQEWRRCKGFRFGGKIANEGWGQGEGRANAVGVAGMLARLAAAANAAPAQTFPHLIDHISDAKGQRYALPLEQLAEPQALAVDTELAKLILQGMSSHQTGGTAHSACVNVYDGKACDSINWIAGKTGTPPFHFDEEPLAQVQKTCPEASQSMSAECNVLPYKWYVAAFKTKGEADAPYDKVIAVLGERNWNVKTGLVQAPGDHGVNLSAELAMRIIKTLRPEKVPAPSKKPVANPPKPNKP